MVIHCISTGIKKISLQKQSYLDFEYNGFQWWMQFGIDKGILSRSKGAKGWVYKKDKIKYKNYPLIIHHIDIKTRWKLNNTISKNWLKISVAKKKGIGVWLPLTFQKELPNKKYLRDSLLLKNKKDNYEIRLVYDIPINKTSPKNIMAVDLGEKIVATIVDSTGVKEFLGKDIRGIRRHYAWLRKKLGNKKLLKKIKDIGNKEHYIINNKLHHIANKIIKIAETNNDIIVIGKLKGIRKSVEKLHNKKLNRIIANMPYYKLTTMIKYKAEQKGIQVFIINEAYTSITCHKCKNIDKTNRKTQGLFKCSNCGLEYNADLNGAINILNRAKEQDFLAGVIAETHKLNNNNVVSVST